MGHFINSRDQVTATKLNEQLAQPFVQHWWHKGRINPIFYYALDPDSLLDGAEFREGLFCVEMLVDGKKQRAKVTFYHGRIYSVQLPKPFDFYKDKSIILGKVTTKRANQSGERAVDRLEHWRDNDWA